MWRRSTVVSLAVLVACGGDDDPPAGTPDAGTPYETCLPDCPGSRDYDAIGYAITAELDWDERTLSVGEDITLALGAAKVVTLDAAVTVVRVHQGDTDLPYVHDATSKELRVDLTSVTGAFTVDYTVAPSDALIVAPPRVDDPVGARVYFTDSEPNRARKWLVSNDHPADRATFAAELRVPVGEDAIANGRRIGDEVVGDTRIVRYEMPDPIPTYLMAFAAGELAHTDRTTGRVPLAVWHRAGLVVDAEANLDVMAEAMALFEEKLGPYPFESYAVVLLPSFGGGMENATITFNLESSGQATPSLGLHAHELGHQWFGDWVTMADYRDLWVKEGMATLLAAEASKSRRDVGNVGRYMGGDFSFDPDDAIVDDTLVGLAKYDSGPYQRAAWLITQIRRRVGEDVFWATLRDVLAEHALGSLDGEAFVRAFAPDLDEPTIAKVLASLEVKQPPILTIGTTPVAGGTDVSIILADLGGTLIAPIEVTVVSDTGAATTTPLVVDAPVVVNVPHGGYLAPDEEEVHPYWGSSFSLDGDGYYAGLVPLMIPPEGPARTAFLARSAGHQERAVFEQGLTLSLATELGPVYDGLDSFLAARELLQDACDHLPFVDPAETAGWIDALAPIVVDPPSLTYSTRYGHCGVDLANDSFGAELAGLVIADDTPAAQRRLEYLIAFDYGPATSLAGIGALVTQAASSRLRDQALSRLVSQIAGAYSPIADPAPWKTLLGGLLHDDMTSGRFRTVFRGLRLLGDRTVLPQIADLLHTLPLSGATQRETVCGVHQMTGGDADWAAFLVDLAPIDTLAPTAQAAATNPAGCP